MSLARSTALVTALTLLGFVFGLAVQILLAHRFGAGAETDAWFAALAVPNFLGIALFASLGKALLPLYLRRREEDPEGAGRLVSGVFHSSLGALLLVAGAAALLAEPLARMLYPSFDPVRFAAARDLLRVSVLAVPGSGAAIVLSTVLQGGRRFALPAAAAVLQPLGVFLGLVLLGGSLGVTSLAVGLVAGSWAQLAVQLPVLARAGWRATLALDDPDVRTHRRRLLPLLAAALLSASIVVMEKRFASGLTRGGVSWLAYARRPLNLVTFLAAATVSVTAFTAFAESLTRRDEREFSSRVYRAFATLLMLLLPPLVLSLVYAPEVFSVLLERGEFLRRDTLEAAASFRRFLPVALLAPLAGVASQAFFARGRTGTPLLAALLGAALYAALGGLAVAKGEHLGLAALNSAAVTVTAAVLIAALIRSLGRPRDPAFLVSLAGILLAGLATGLALDSLRPWLPGLDAPLLSRIGGLAAAGAVDVAVFFGILAAGRNPHLQDLWKDLLGGRRPTTRG